MLNNALSFLIDTAGGLFVYALLLRFYMQWARVPFNNPLSPFIFALTDFMVKPARKIIPGFLGLDMATFALAWLGEICLLYSSFWLKGFSFPFSGSAFLALFLLGLVGLLKQSLNILMFALVLQAVMSWVNPYNPLSPLLSRLTGPFLGFFRKRLPPVGNVDLSPLFALVVIQLILMLPVAWLEMTVSRLL